jgi:two-component system, cell cycle sensor histidine kinase and response regulator CckA
MSEVDVNTNSHEQESFLAKRVLIVDDDKELNRLIQKSLLRAGYEVYGAFTGKEALNFLEKNTDIVLLLDQRLPDMTGIELINTLTEKDKLVPFVAMTGQGDEKIAVEMMKLGAKDYLIKNFELTDILPQIFHRVFSELETSIKLQKANDDLAESNEKYKALFERESDAIFIYDPETTNILDANEATSTMYGYSQDELIGMSCLKLSADAKKSSAAINTISVNGNIDVPLRYHQKKDGTIFPIEISGHKITLLGKDAMFAVSKDITEQNKAKVALEKSEDQYRSLFENMLNAFALHEIVLDKDNNPVDYIFIEVNSAFEKETGLVGKEIAGKKATEVLPGIENDPADWIGVYGNVAVSGEELRFEQYSESLNKWYSVIAFSPKKNCFATIFADITQPKQAEEEILRSKILLESSIESQKSFIILSLDLEYRYLFFNKTHSDSMVATYNSHPEIGDCIFDHMNIQEDIDKAKTHYARALSGENHNAIEEYGEGELRLYYEIRYNPIYNQQNNIIGVTAFAEDITERKLAEEKLREINDLLQNSIDCMPTAYIAWNKDFLVEEWNRAAQEIFGFSKEEMMGKNAADYIVPEEIRPLVGAVLTKLKHGEVSEYSEKNNNIHKDGQFISCQWFNTPLIDHNGNISGFITLAQDITQRLEAEEVLWLNESRYRTIIETAMDGYWIVNTKGKFLEVNDAYCNMIGYSQDELLSMSIPDIEGKESSAETAKHMKILAKEGHERFESCHIRKNGSKIQVDVSAQFRDVDGGQFVVFVRDITERKLIENNLRINDQRWHQAQEAAKIGNWEYDIANNQIWGSEEAFTVYGITLDLKDNPDQTLSLETVQERIPDRERVNKALMDLINEDKPYDLEFEILRTDSKRTQFIYSVAQLERDSSGRPIKVHGTIQDITDKKIQEEELIQNEKKFRSVIEQSNDAIYILFNDRFDLINNRFTELTGFTSEEVAAPDYDFYAMLSPAGRVIIDEREQMRARGETPPKVYEFEMIHKNGAKHLVQASVNQIEYKNGIATLGFARDISEFKALEDQLRHSQKIESIGHLAGGIAHDFNNLLTPIIGNAELALLDLNPIDPLYNDLNDIHITARRAGELTRQLLAFSRKQILEVKTLDMNVIIANFRSILRRTIREDIEIEMNFNKLDGMVNVDISQIEQVLMNLFVNAQDAMLTGGKIELITETVILDEAYSEDHHEVTPGKYAQITVSDTGEGMDAETIDRIFEPFYTTKAEGKGTGLGLSTTHGIVKQHGGNIWVYSELGHGTVFKLYFPLVEGEADSSIDSIIDSKKYHGTETIMIVEDQDQVRRVAERILKSNKYKVYVASDGNEAVSIIRDNNLTIDLLLTDVVMPNMNGKELSALISGICPEMKILFMSGYTQDVISHHGVIDKEINFIQKPLSYIGLSKKVRDVLNS